MQCSELLEQQGGTIHWPDVLTHHHPLCALQLASLTHPPGSNGKYLLTKVELCPVTAKIRCTNQHCMARYG